MRSGVVTARLVTDEGGGGGCVVRRRVVTVRLVTGKG